MPVVTNVGGLLVAEGAVLRQSGTRTKVAATSRVNRCPVAYAISSLALGSEGNDAPTFV